MTQDEDILVSKKVVESLVLTISGLREEVAELVGALELYRGIAGHDCDKSTTKWSAADAVLAKIKGVER